MTCPLDGCATRGAANNMPLLKDFIFLNFAVAFRSENPTLTTWKCREYDIHFGGQAIPKRDLDGRG
jgi:hypothetical protein